MIFASYDIGGLFRLLQQHPSKARQIVWEVRTYRVIMDLTESICAMVEEKEGYRLEDQPILSFRKVDFHVGRNQIDEADCAQSHSRPIVACRIEEDCNDIEDHTHHPRRVVLFQNHCV